MFYNLSFKTVVALFLVASSKGILIYNEETLVALSFVLFVVFSLRYLSSTVQNSLQERADAIKSEFANLDRLREENCSALLAQHESMPGSSDQIHSITQLCSALLEAQAEQGKPCSREVDVKRVSWNICLAIKQSLSLFERLPIQQKQSSNGLFCESLKDASTPYSC